MVFLKAFIYTHCNQYQRQWGSTSPLWLRSSRLMQTSFSHLLSFIVFMFFSNMFLWHWRWTAAERAVRFSLIILWPWIKCMQWLPAAWCFVVVVEFFFIFFTVLFDKWIQRENVCLAMTVNTIRDLSVPCQQGFVHSKLCASWLLASSTVLMIHMLMSITLSYWRKLWRP